MRLYGLALVPSFPDACKQICDGEKFSSLVDRDGKKLRDHYLKEKLGQTYDWISIVYERTSGFVHFSAANIFAAIGNVSEDGESNLVIGGGGNQVAQEHFNEVGRAFAHILAIVADMLESLRASIPD